MQIIVERKENSNTIAFAIVFLVGAINEPNTKSGITHLVEHMIFRRAGDKTQREIYDYFERLGVKIEASTGPDFIRFFFVCRLTVFNKVIQLFYEMLFEFGYTDDEFNAEKAVILSEMEERDLSNGQIIINEAWCNKNLSKDILGTVQSLNRIRLSHLIDYKRKLLSNDGAVFLFGNIGNAEYNLVEKLFGRREINRVKYDTNKVKVKLASRKVKFIDDEYDLIDIYYVMHFQLCNETRDKTIVCIQMLNSALFQGDAAYIKENIRENMGLIYDVDSTVRIIDNEVVLLFNFQVNKKNLLTCVDSIERALNNFIFDDRYFSYIKAFFCENVIMLKDNFRERVEQYIDNYIYFRKVKSPEQYGQLVGSIPLTEYNTVYKNLVHERRIYCFGNISDFQKRSIRLHFLK